MTSMFRKHDAAITALTVLHETLLIPISYKYTDYVLVTTLGTKSEWLLVSNRPFLRCVFYSRTQLFRRLYSWTTGISENIFLSFIAYFVTKYFTRILSRATGYVNHIYVLSRVRS